MSNPNKRKGDRFENALRDHLRTHGYPHADKTRAGYERDHGDLHPCGNRDVVLQAKNVARTDLSGWLTQLADQIRFAGARTGAVIIKRRLLPVGRSYAVLELDDYLALLTDAGYGQDATREPAPLATATEPR